MAFQNKCVPGESRDPRSMRKDHHLSFSWGNASQVCLLFTLQGSLLNLALACCTANVANFDCRSKCWSNVGVCNIEGKSEYLRDIMWMWSQLNHQNSRLDSITMYYYLPKIHLSVFFMELSPPNQLLIYSDCEFEWCHKWYIVTTT